MKLMALAVIAAVLVCAGGVYAAECSTKASSGNLGTETVNTVTDTAQSAVNGTTSVVETTVTDTAETPKTAIQVVKDTANTALTGTDRAIKTITGEDR